MKRTKYYLLSLSILAVILGGCTPKKINTSIDVKNMDLSVNPGDDFFRYVNGNYLKTLEIPDDKTSYNVFNILRENADRDINNILKEVSDIQGAEKGSATQQISDFYFTGMNIEEINKVGIKALDKEFKMIDEIETLGQFQDMVAYMHLHGLDPFFGGSVMQDLADNTKLRYYLAQAGTGLPDVEYYLKDDDRSKEIRTEYVKHISKMLGFTGEDGPQSSKWASTIMEIETFMAQNSKTRMEMRNIPALYNLMSMDSLQTIIPDFDWERYFSKMSDQDFGDFVVMTPKYFEAMGTLLAQTKLEDLKIYLKWNLLNRSANYLNDAIVNRDFQFYSAFLSGSKQIQDRWKRVTQTTNAMMGEPLGQLYVEKHFPPSSKEQMNVLVANLKVALKQRLENLTWMNEVTKVEALAKLETMKVKIGYPDKWDDYSELTIERDSYLQNVRRVNYFETQKNLKKFTEPIDPDEWPMTPQTVNAGYSPLKNDITFPAGILQPPYFNPEADDAVNYGAIGVVIGHEMTHGFDDQGRNFNKDGVMTNWWTDEDSKEFMERAQLLIDQYNEFKVNEEVNVNGQLSLGENIADFGGLTVSLKAYKNSLSGKETPADIDGFNNIQRFFLSYGQIWRGKIREKALVRKTQEDVHPWGEYRVNGAPFNVPEFYEAFDIKAEDALYRTIEQRPIIW
jgi:putative endopeptidase